METQSEKTRKKRKFLLVLPMLALPFVTFAFWALGGGKGGDGHEQPLQQGINTELPGAQLENGTLDKLSLYKRSGDTPEEASPDSIPDSLEWEAFDQYLAQGHGDGTYGYGNPDPDPNEARVRQRLEELERMIGMQEPAGGEYPGTGYDNGYGYDPYGESDASLERLELMMERMSSPTEPDPELEVLDGMLEKIIDIQHPDRMREQSLENRGTVYPVSRQKRNNGIPHMQRPEASISGAAEDSVELWEPVTERWASVAVSRNGFYSLATPVDVNIDELAGIPAVIHETQTVVNGANLKMRLAEDIYVNGILIPAGHFITGECSLGGERLQVKVSGIQYGNYQLPVSLSVFDRDGLAGIRIPGAISRDAVKGGTDRTIQSLQLMNMDPSLWGQAAGAGIETIKGLLSKKAKLVKVTVKAGHPILLFDEQSNNQ